MQMSLAVHKIKLDKSSLSGRYAAPYECLPFGMTHFCFIVVTPGYSVAIVSHERCKASAKN